MSEVSLQGDVVTNLLRFWCVNLIGAMAQFYRITKNNLYLIDEIDL